MAYILSYLYPNNNKSNSHSKMVLEIYKLINFSSTFLLTYLYVIKYKLE